MLQEELTQKILRSYFNVYNRLGYGFLEKVYENAMVLELSRQGVHGRRQVPITVYDVGIKVGDYFADIIVENVVIVELKASEAIHEEHEAQLTNYLRATDIEIGFLCNFCKKPEFKRKIFENKLKKSVPIR